MFKMIWEGGSVPVKAAIVATALVMPGAAAYADGNGQSSFEAMDTDNNNVVSRIEARAFFDQLFTKLDQNNDGILTVDEMPRQINGSNVMRQCGSEGCLKKE